MSDRLVGVNGTTSAGIDLSLRKDISEVDIFTEFPLRAGRVAIVGFATETMGEAPWDDPTCEIWILNMLHANVPRWDRLWEMHDRSCVEQESSEKEQSRLKERGGQRHLEVLQAERERPIYMVEPWDDVPMARRFPIETYQRWMGWQCPKIAEGYYTSTFAYMIAAAIRGITIRRKQFYIPEPDELIAVAGVEMLNGSEYVFERSCAEFWCGVALGCGITVHIPARSALLESDGLYGYAHAHETLDLLSRTRAYYEDRKKMFRADAEAAQRRFNQARADWNTWDGARQALDRLYEAAQIDPEAASDWTPGALRLVMESRDRAERERQAADVRREEAHVERHLALGAAQGVDWCVSHVTYLSRGGKV